MITKGTSSDFMWRLASRATGDAAAIEPRLPSLFEKGPGDPIGLVQSSVAVEDAPADLARSPRDVPRASHEQKSRPDIVLQDQHKASDDVVPGFLRTGFSLGRKTTFEPPDTEAAVRGYRQVEAPLGSVSFRTSTVTAAADDDLPASTRKEGADEPSVMRPTPRPSDQKADAVSPPWASLAMPVERAIGHPVNRTDFEPSRHGDDRNPDRREPAPFAAPPSASRWRPLVPQAELPNPATPEPVVNITIGRVEVRAAIATTPQAATQKRATAPLGLDDYLQGRTRSK
jgi:hypothetical protein